MKEKLKITHIHFISAKPHDKRQGIRGWISFILNDCLQVDGICLRQTLDKRMTLSFPVRQDRQGKRHYLVRPMNDASRRMLEHQVFEILGVEESA